MAEEIWSEELINEAIDDASADTNWFRFRRDFVKYKMMSKLQALFIQDLHNLSTMKKTKKGKDRFFLCTVEYLHQDMLWDHDIQAKMLKFFQGKGFIDVERRGVPSRRYVRVNWTRVIEALRKAKDSQSSGNTDDCSSGNPDDCQSGNPDEYYKTSSYEEEQRKKHSRDARSARCDSVSPPKTLFGSVKSPPEKALASRLHQILLKHNKVMRTVNLDKWTKPFKDLLTSRTVDQIGKVLNWYEENIGKKYTVKAYSAQKFVSRFFDIEDAMNQNQGDGSDASTYVEVPIVLHQRIGKNTIKFYDYAELERKGNVPKWRWEGEGMEAKAYIIDKEWRP